MNLYDVVELAVDLPEKGLEAGMIGTVVDIYDEPLAFEVEFDDEEGEANDEYDRPFQARKAGHEST